MFSLCTIFFNLENCQGGRQSSCLPYAYCFRVWLRVLRLEGQRDSDKRQGWDPVQESAEVILGTALHSLAGRSPLSEKKDLGTSRQKEKRQNMTSQWAYIPHGDISGGGPFLIFSEEDAIEDKGGVSG